MITRNRFGRLPDGRSVELFTLANAHGIEVRAITFGGIIVSLLTPDRHGTRGDIVLGHDELQPYVEQTTYFGAIVGRYANRIARGRFSIGGRSYQLATNNGRNHLHGGIRGFDKQLWDAAHVRTSHGDGVVFSRTSPDGEEGYPGTLNVRVQYVLTDADELQVEYEAETDAPTIVNLTQHSYFDLSCGQAEDVTGHVLALQADAFTPVDGELIPTGEIASVTNTPFDFRTPVPIGSRLADAHEQLEHGGGYDHNWVLNRSGGVPILAASLLDPASGRLLEVLTTEPGIQFYSGNQLDGTVFGKGGRRYRARTGVCLETQSFPDAPNHDNFPSPELRPGQIYRSRTIFRFSVAS